MCGINMKTRHLINLNADQKVDDTLVDRTVLYQQHRRSREEPQNRYVTRYNTMS